MRDWSRWVLWLVLPLVGGACGTTPAITVVRTADGDKSSEVQGDPVKLKRGPQEVYAGARGGFHVIRNADDWKEAWPSDWPAPPLPPPLEAGHGQMVVLASAESTKVDRIHVERAVETAEVLYVWVRESALGAGCVTRRGAPRAYDAVATARVDKPVRVFVSEDRSESCGDAPKTTVECRVTTPGVKDPTWASKLAAQPGDTIECTYTASAQGKFTLVDKGLAIGELPSGSSAKLSFRKGPDRGELDVDVYGTYTITAEAADEAGRRGRSNATIDVKPPKTKDVLVQLVWTGFEVKDGSETFPRVNLRVAEESKGQRCSAEIPIPGLCEVKTRGAYTYMQIPAGNRRLPVSVQYLDERADKGASPCVHVWFDGARTGEICDRSRRSADEVWRIGVLDTTTGRLALDAASGPASAVVTDGGAPKSR